MVPVSNDTLLRVVRPGARQPTEVLKVVGIDDWAWRKNHRYGSVVCDLERRRIVALLPDREIATVATWLADHPEIDIVSRDRGGTDLWRQLREKGFRGSLRVVGEWTTRRRQAETTSDQQLHRVPSARTIGRLMTTARDHLSKAETVTVAAIETGFQCLQRRVGSSTTSTL